MSVREAITNSALVTSAKRITVFQLIVTVGLVAPWVTSLWGSTSWIVKPALAGAIADVLKEDGIDLKALVQQSGETSATTEETKKKVEKLDQAIQMQNELLGQINKALQEQKVIPDSPAE